MEKYCTSCGKVFKDSNFKICPFCGNHLNSREGRQPIPRQLRHEVFVRDGYRCKECGASVEDGATLEIDHIIPVAKGGTNDINNLQTLCKECNRAKYTDEWEGGISSADNIIKEFEYLKNEYNEVQKKLSSASSEEDKLELEYQLMKLSEKLSKIYGIVDEFSDDVQKAKEEGLKREETLFKMAYVSLDKFTYATLMGIYGFDKEMPRELALKLLFVVFPVRDIYYKLEEKYYLITNNYNRNKGKELNIELFDIEKLKPYFLPLSKDITFHLLSIKYGNEFDIDKKYSRESLDLEKEIQKIFKETPFNDLRHKIRDDFGIYKDDETLKKYLAEDGYFYCTKCSRPVESNGMLCERCRKPKFNLKNLSKVKITYIDCPYCGMQVNKESFICPYCKSRLE